MYRNTHTHYTHARKHKRMHERKLTHSIKLTCAHFWGAVAHLSSSECISAHYLKVKEGEIAAEKNETEQSWDFNSIVLV